MHQVGLRKAQCLQPCLRALASPTFHQSYLLEGLSSHRAGIQILSCFEDSLSQGVKMPRCNILSRGSEYLLSCHFMC